MVETNRVGRCILCWWSGDTTANLQWRVMNGELPIGTRPKLAVVMIGTNDLGYTEAGFRNGSDITEAAPGVISRCDT